MIERIVSQPFALGVFLLILVLLYVAAAMRVERDRKQKDRARVDRRKTPRPGDERRWHDQRLKKGKARHK